MCKGRIARALVAPVAAVAIVVSSSVTAGASLGDPAEETWDVGDVVPVDVTDDSGQPDAGESLSDVPDAEPDAEPDGGAEGEADALAAPGDEIRTVEGTVHNIAVETDTLPQFGDPMPVVTALEVDGQLFELPAEQTTTLTTGDVVEVTFSADPDLPVAETLGVAAADAEPATLVIEATGQVSEDLVLAEAAVAHAMTVLPVYWSAGPSATTSSLQTLVASTDQFWRDQSGGQLTISPVSVRDWVSVSPPASCDTQAMLDLFTRARSAHGVGSPSATNHYVVFFPQWSSCGWSGMASVGGGMIWINGTVVPDVLAHEYGHNLGLGHANTMTCTSSGSRVPLTLPFGSCSSIEYRDYADVMGIGMSGRPTGNLNTALADHLGLVTLTDVTGAPSSGITKDLAPLGQVSGHRALRTSISGGQLYVDYRPAVGRDTRWSGWAGVQVHIKVIDSRGIPISYLLNMQPASGDFNSPSTVRPQMPVGSAWQIPGTTRSIGVVSAGSVARVTVGSASVVGGTQQAALENYVTRVYADLLGRGVDPTGLSGWTAALASGWPRITVANSITYSREYRSRLITASYNRFLGRGPDPVGLEGWLGAMAAGVTIQHMESGFIASAEYYNKAGGTDAAWITKLYADVLSRTPSSADLQNWTLALSRGANRQQVAFGFLMSYEHLSTVVNGHYLHLLGRGCDPVGRHGWVTAIQGGVRVEAVIGGIIASDEYFNKS